jgi:microcystin-dependent protein
MAGAQATQAKPNGAILASLGAPFYTGAASLTAMNSAILTQFGSGQSHENRQPYLVMNWCIAYTGIFPSRN